MYGHGLANFGGIAFIIFISVVFGELAFRFKISNALISLGNISYSLYISHIIIMYAYNEFGNLIPFIPQQHGVSLLLFMVAASLLLSYAMYRMIEIPSIKISHFICKKF